MLSILYSLRKSKGVRIPCISMAVIILCLCLACVPVLANSDVILVTDTTANPAHIPNPFMHFKLTDDI